MIEIKKIRIEEQKDTVRLCADVLYKGNSTILWYEVKSENKKFLCDERADAFVDALLLFAMEHSEDIKVEKTPISTKLHFNLVNYMIPSLAKLNGKYKKINIYSNICNDEIKNFGFNGSGISRGVDSFFTLKEHQDEFKLDYLTFFNVGSHKDFGGPEANSLFLSRMKLSEKFALDNGYNFIWVNSNISEFLKQIFVETHTFRSTSAVFAIQKLFKNYYYSSGYSIYEFKVLENVPARFEIFLLNMLSNDNIFFYSSGCLDNRLEKVEKISDYKFAQKNLNVCFNDEINCNCCEKCIRTIYELYAIDYLEKFKNVFDIERFKNNRNWYELRFMQKYYAGKHDYIDVYRKIKKSGKKIKKINKIGGFFRFLILEKIKNKIPKQIREKMKGYLNEKRK